MVGDPIGEKVLYVERWNDLTRQPTKGYSWLSTNKAAQRYESKREDFAIVDGMRDNQGGWRPRWVIGIAHNGVRVRFFTPGGGSIWRSIDYDAREGRLWRWITTEYVYQNDDEFHPEFESTHMYTAQFEPDGTGSVEFREEAKKNVDVARMTEAPVSGFWMDWPEFGEWDLLADPDYGLPPGGIPAP